MAQYDPQGIPGFREYLEYVKERIKDLEQKYDRLDTRQQRHTTVLAVITTITWLVWGAMLAFLPRWWWSP